MPFAKGQSGNPGGRATEKIWRDALLKAVKDKAEKGGGRKLEMVAKALVDAACEGDIQAIKELGDRIDGKSPQTIPEGAAGVLAHLIIDDGYGKR
jgi:hypothetical protein